jgi:hypothetical protein
MMYKVLWVLQFGLVPVIFVLSLVNGIARAVAGAFRDTAEGIREHIRTL